MSKCTTTHNKYQGNLFMFCVFKNKIPNNKLKSLLRQLVVFVLYCSNCSQEELYTTMLELNRYIMFQQPVYNIVGFLIGFLVIYLFLAFLANKKDSVPIKDLQEILYLKVFKIPGSHKKKNSYLTVRALSKQPKHGQYFHIFDFAAFYIPCREYFFWLFDCMSSAPSECGE